MGLKRDDNCKGPIYPVRSHSDVIYLASIWTHRSLHTFSSNNINELSSKRIRTEIVMNYHCVDFNAFILENCFNSNYFRWNHPVRLHIVNLIWQCSSFNAYTPFSSWLMKYLQPTPRQACYSIAHTCTKVKGYQTVNKIHALQWLIFVRANEAIIYTWDEYDRKPYATNYINSSGKIDSRASITVRPVIKTNHNLRLLSWNDAGSQCDLPSTKTTENLNENSKGNPRKSILIYNLITRPTRYTNIVAVCLTDDNRDSVMPSNVRELNDIAVNSRN